MKCIRHKLKFDEIYSGEWPYELSDGVGLSFKGVPTNYMAFLDLLMSVSCNPVSSRRILAILERGEEKLVTVMASLDFNYIGYEMQQLGVTMSIIPPYDYGLSNYVIESEEIDRAVFMDFLGKPYEINEDEKSLAIFRDRQNEFKESITRTPNGPNGFGYYE